MGKTVRIVGGNGAYLKMFEMYGWSSTLSLTNADLILFTGGADVSPHLYGEEPHPHAFNDPMRDEAERSTYLLVGDKPKAGICRGGQFLNVMNGGKMYQHVDKHGVAGTHKAIDVRSGREVQVSSTHHQMMRPGKGAETLCIASRSTFKEHMVEGSIYRVDGTTENDTEVVVYRDTNSLCFQPHPEFVANSEDYRECADYFFECLEEIL